MADNTVLRSGFWGTFVQHLAFLPIALRDNLFYFEGPWEHEDNDDLPYANGPIRSGRDYYGYPNDPYDYFSIYADAGSITVDLTNCNPNRGHQLCLLDTNGHLVGPCDSGPKTAFHLAFSALPAGTYYILVYTASNFSDQDAYTLRAVYP